MFSQILTKLKKTKIKIINPPEIFFLIISKSFYLTELENKGIKIIPTSISNPDNNDDIINLINKSKNKFVVLKPDHGARAKGIVFIKKINANNFEIIIPSNNSNDIKSVNVDKLKEFFLDYKKNHYEKKVLVQNYLYSDKEISAIYINGTCRFVETTKPTWQGALIAHDEHGGKNIPLLNVDEKLKNFTEKVYKAMPNCFRNNSYIRVDILQSEGLYYLLEIEAGTPRLFLKETSRYKEYSELFLNRIRGTTENYSPSLPVQSIAIIGGGLSGVAVFSSIVKNAIENNCYNIKISIFEKNSNIGPGLAYDLSLPDSFILNHEKDYMGSVNVNLQKMDCNDFSLWLEDNILQLKKHYPQIDFNSKFIPRNLYGKYISHRFKEVIDKSKNHNIQVKILNKDVSSIDFANKKFIINNFEFDNIILATGHWQKKINNEINGKKSPQYPYPHETYMSNEVKGSNATMLITGTGLSAYDVALYALESKKFKNVILASRNAYLRRVRGDTEPYSLKYLTEQNINKSSQAGKDNNFHHLVNLINKEIKNINSGNEIDFHKIIKNSNPIEQLEDDILNEELGITPIWRKIYYAISDSLKNKIYKNLEPHEKNMFFQKYYSIFQHYQAPIPLLNAKRLLFFIKQGKVNIISNVDVNSIFYDEKNNVFKSTQHDSINADVWINATGLSRDISELPLYRNLIKQNIVEPNIYGGIKVDLDSHNVITNSQIQKNVFAIGAMCCGETILTHNSLQISQHALEIGKNIINAVLINNEG